MELYVLHTLIETTTIIATFDLCTCLEKALIFFALVVNYINKKWEMCHIIVEIFKVHETSRVTMVV